MCVRWIEGHLGGPAALLFAAALDTLAHSVMGCWAEIKSAHGHIKTPVKEQERGKSKQCFPAESAVVSVDRQS